MHSRLTRLALMLFTSCASTFTFAERYAVPTEQQSLIGDIQYVTTSGNDDVVSIAKKYNIGFNAIKSANPDHDFTKSFYPGTVLTISNQHILPTNKREGIVINLPEMRMYYFPRNSKEVLTYPIGIGKIGNTIPITNTHIVKKVENPTWTPTENIRKFNLEQGIVLPKVMKAGPENPLGQYAIYTGLPTYLIHSTIFPESVGKRASFGCIRMFVPDIESFFPTIEKNIPVFILNNPTKIGLEDNKVYMESHEALEEHKKDYEASLPATVHKITEATDKNAYLIDWQLVSYLNNEKDGMPHEIGFQIQ